LVGLKSAESLSCGFSVGGFARGGRLSHLTLFELSGSAAMPRPKLSAAISLAGLFHLLKKPYIRAASQRLNGGTHAIEVNVGRQTGGLKK
jgi:hypothetical protein